MLYLDVVSADSQHDGGVAHVVWTVWVVPSLTVWSIFIIPTSLHLSVITQ